MVIDHNIIVAQQGSEVTVVRDYSTGRNDMVAFHNGVTKMFVKENAIVNTVKIQRLNDLSYNFDSNIVLV